jgi:hypothetical protein
MSRSYRHTQRYWDSLFAFIATIFLDILGPVSKQSSFNNLVSISNFYKMVYEKTDLWCLKQPQFL